MFYIIDKEIGISSFDVIRRLRKETGIKKMGHIGTLDPFASGLMIIAGGNSTKLIPLLEGADKEYIATFHLDGTSETLDTDSPILPIDTSSYRARSLDEVTSFLLSLTSQTPPRYSALHVDGVRAYELARGGKDFTLPSRPVCISECEVLSMEGYRLELRIIISSGGYIRSLAPELAKFFGVDGGYVSSLRRTRIFTKYQVFSIDDVPAILGLRDTFHTIHTYTVDDDIITRLMNGQSIYYSSNDFHHTQVDELLFLENHDGTFVSLCQKNDDSINILKNNVGYL